MTVKYLRRQFIWQTYNSTDNLDPTEASSQQTQKTVQYISLSIPNTCNILSAYHWYSALYAVANASFSSHQFLSTSKPNRSTFWQPCGSLGDNWARITLNYDQSVWTDFPPLCFTWIFSNSFDSDRPLLRGEKERARGREKGSVWLSNVAHPVKLCCYSASLRNNNTRASEREMEQKRWRSLTWEHEQRKHPRQDEEIHGIIHSSNLISWHRWTLMFLHSLLYYCFSFNRNAVNSAVLLSFTILKCFSFSFDWCSLCWRLFKSSAGCGSMQQPTPHSVFTHIRRDQCSESQGRGVVQLCSTLIGQGFWLSVRPSHCSALVLLEHEKFHILGLISRLEHLEVISLDAKTWL